MHVSAKFQVSTSHRLECGTKGARPQNRGVGSIFAENRVPRVLVGVSGGWKKSESCSGLYAADPARFRIGGVFSLGYKKCPEIQLLYQNRFHSVPGWARHHHEDIGVDFEVASDEAHRVV